MCVRACVCCSLVSSDPDCVCVCGVKSSLGAGRLLWGDGPMQHSVTLAGRPWLLLLLALGLCHKAGIDQSGETLTNGSVMV